ncbi:MAG: ABC transporter permease subunit [Oscillospiraceae bacterium]|nr:ABC transporter permease subunit [Oscillospiraceae bacterium]
MKASSLSRSRVKKLLAAAGAFAFWLAVWQLAHMYVGRDFLLTSPARTLDRMLGLAGEAAFWRALSATGLRVISGFGLAMLSGAVLALVSAGRPWVKTLLGPMIGTVRATPVVSFILLAIMWMTSHTLPMFIAFLMVLPLAYSNLLSGLENLDRQLLEMTRLFKFPRRRVLRLIYIPSLMPYLTAACATGLGFAWKSAIAAEVIAHPALSVGRQIHRARIYFEVADLFAWTLTVIIISVLLEKVTLRLLRALTKRLLRLSTTKGGESGA